MALLDAGSGTAIACRSRSKSNIAGQNSERGWEGGVLAKGLQLVIHPSPWGRSGRALVHQGRPAASAVARYGWRTAWSYTEEAPGASGLVCFREQKSLNLDSNLAASGAESADIKKLD